MKISGGPVSLWLVKQPQITGGFGNDRINGGGGNDVIDGQADVDTCAGCPGTNTVICEMASGG